MSRHDSVWNCLELQIFPTKATKLSSRHGVSPYSLTLKPSASDHPINSSFIHSLAESIADKTTKMEFSSSELAGRGRPLRQRRCGRCRRQLLPALLLLLLLLAVAGHSPAAASIFGGDAASVRMILARQLITSIRRQLKSTLIVSAPPRRPSAGVQPDVRVRALLRYVRHV